MQFAESFEIFSYATYVKKVILNGLSSSLQVTVVTISLPSFTIFLVGLRKNSSTVHDY